MIDWQSLLYAMGDAFAVLAYALPVVFVVDAFFVGASDCLLDEEE